MSSEELKIDVDRSPSLFLAGLVVAVLALSALVGPRSDATSHTDPPPAIELFPAHPEAIVETVDPRSFLSPEELQRLTEAEIQGVIRSSRLSPTFEELSALDGFIDGGYASSESNVLQVTWHGDLSAEARESIRQANARGLDVQVKYAALSREEFDEALDAILSALQDESVDVTSIRLGNDRAWVEIGVSPSISDDKLSRASDIIKGFSQGVQVSLVRKDLELSQTYGSRRDDTGTFDGAGTAYPTSGEACTSGIPLQRTGHGDYLVTAAHCTNHANGMEVKTPSNRVMGSNSWTIALWGSTSTTNPPASHANKYVDATLIVLSGSDASGRLFVGDQFTTSKVDIKGHAWIPYNTTLCSSGSSTGTNCNFERGNHDQWICMYGSVSICTAGTWVVRMDTQNGQVMFGSGDSGGPVFYYSSSHQGQVVVAMVQGGAASGQVFCGPDNSPNPVSIYDGALCSVDDGYVVALSHVLARLDGNGFSVKTAP